jgi:hypothetical protein
LLLFATALGIVHEVCKGLLKAFVGLLWLSPAVVRVRVVRVQCLPKKKRTEDASDSQKVRKYGPHKIFLVPCLVHFCSDLLAQVALEP